jgi:hypothetical protein
MGLLLSFHLAYLSIQVAFEASDVLFETLYFL